MRRIIGIGNRLCPEDAAGPQVCDLIRRDTLPQDLEVIDSGLAGLNVLSHAEGAERVVFVDTVSGFGRPGEVLVLQPEEVAATAAPRHDHAAGLAYALRMLPAVFDGRLPKIAIVGIEKPADATAIAKAAALAVELATNGWAQRGAE